MGGSLGLVLFMLFILVTLLVVCTGGATFCIRSLLRREMFRVSDLLLIYWGRLEVGYF